MACARGATILGAPDQAGSSGGAGTDYLAKPVGAVFLSLSLGHFIGKLRVAPGAPGGVCGAPFVALAIGQAGVAAADDCKNVPLALFIHVPGLTAGPQFSPVSVAGCDMAHSP